MDNDKKRFCAKCGAALEEDALFCAECGTPIMKKEESTAIPQTETIKEEVTTENFSNSEVATETISPESDVPPKNTTTEELPITEPPKEELAAIAPLPVESSTEEIQKGEQMTQQPSEAQASVQDSQQAVATTVTPQQPVRPQPQQFQQPQQQIPQHPMYSVPQPHPNIAIVPKDRGLAATLGLVFGPAGLLYATIKGGLIMICIAIPLYFILLLISGLTFGVGLIFFVFVVLLIHTVCALWGYKAANTYNKELMSGKLPAIVGNDIPMPSATQNWKNPFQR